MSGEITIYIFDDLDWLTFMFTIHGQILVSKVIHPHEERLDPRSWRRQTNNFCHSGLPYHLVLSLSSDPCTYRRTDFRLGSWPSETGSNFIITLVLKVTKVEIEKPRQKFRQSDELVTPKQKKKLVVRIFLEIYYLSYKRSNVKGFVVPTTH